MHWPQNQHSTTTLSFSLDLVRQTRCHKTTSVRACEEGPAVLSICQFLFKVSLYPCFILATVLQIVTTSFVPK